MGLQRKRVLHIAHDLTIGGTQQVIKQLINSLDRVTFECSVLCIDGELGVIGDELKEEGIEIHVLERSQGVDIALVNAIRLLLKTEAIDLVHCHQYTPFTYGVLAAMFTKVKIIFTEHGRFYPDSYSWKRRILNPFFQLRTSAIVAISAATANALATYEWFSRNTIEVIYNGTVINGRNSIQEQTRSALGLTTTTLVFGTIARFDEIKNIPMMIDAFAHVLTKLPNARLLLVGDGEQREYLEALVRNAQMKSSVIFTGFQSDTTRYMSIIDIYLLTSFSEGTSMTLLESMAAGKPSIVTAVGGNVEIVEHNKNGLVVESGDTQALTECMFRLANDYELRKQFGASARVRFERGFSVESMTARYDSIYRRSLGLTTT